MKHATMHDTKAHTLKEAGDAIRFPVEILRKLRMLTHLRRREVKRLRRWAFFDL